MRKSCAKCGEEFTKFGYLASDDPLCPECREAKEDEEGKTSDQEKEGSHPLSFIFGKLW